MILLLLEPVSLSQIPWTTDQIHKHSTSQPEPARQHNMIGLPDPDACPVFQYYDRATGTIQDVTYADGSQPRRIDNYILDPADWQTEKHTHKNKSSRSSPGTRPPSGTGTRAAVLAHGVDEDEPCRVCGRKGQRCRGDSCARTFRRRMELVVSSDKLRIERTGAQGVALGYGVFAGSGIRRGDIVGEYVGRLHPSDGRGKPKGGYEYVFELDGIATVDAREYGSVGPFVFLCHWEKCFVEGRGEMQREDQQLILGY